MQSVSLWAEATWYRLGGGRPTGHEATPGEPAGSSAPTAPVEITSPEDEKVLVSR